ncbi:MAG: hypothetical protein IPK34_12805 [Ramlibacter sp.]|nr:hypothetical protein [Ramlibacter sp.]
MTISDILSAGLSRISASSNNGTASSAGTSGGARPVCKWARR